MISQFRVLIRRTFSSLKRTMPPPDRWEAYSPMGSVIPGTKFIAFKVPLKEELLKQVEEKDRFSPAILMKLLSEQGLKLAGVIDLSFTFKYYNIEEFLKNSVGHKKVFTPGHVVPSESVFQQFAHAVKSFDVDDKDQVIGVHCTHGVNRTGYLICRYMIEEMNYEPDDAIALFDEARGHKLERENYLNDLRNRKSGQSSYDPNFELQNVQRISERIYDNPNPVREKPRWRHHREDHPDWRRKYHCSSHDDEARFEPQSNNSQLDVTGDISEGNSHPTHDRNNQFVDRHRYNPYRIPAHGVSDHYCGDTQRYSRDRPAHEGSNHDWSARSESRSNLDLNWRERQDPTYTGFNPNWRDRQDPTYTGFNPNLAGYGHNGSYPKVSRFDSRYSYRNPAADRVKEDGSRHNDKNSD